MSADTQSKTSPAALFAKWIQQNPSPLHAYFKGRIEKIEARQSPDGRRIFDHEVICPAADEYSGPARLSISHSQRMGSVGDEIAGVFRGNYWFDRPLPSKKPDSNGEFKMWRPIRHSLILVELF